MKGTDASLSLADYYYPILNTLSRKAKLYLVKRLTDSLLKDESAATPVLEDDKQAIFNELSGAWADDPESDMMETEIRNGRTSGKTRMITSFDE